MLNVVHFGRDVDERPPCRLCIPNCLQKPQRRRGLFDVINLMFARIDRHHVDDEHHAHHNKQRTANPQHEVEPALHNLWQKHRYVERALEKVNRSSHGERETDAERGRLDERDDLPLYVALEPIDSIIELVLDNVEELEDPIRDNADIDEDLDTTCERAGGR